MQKFSRDTKRIESGVDWLTMTTSQPHRKESWRQAYDAISTEQLKAGAIEKPGGVHGYTGHTLGHLFIGERPDGVMCRLSSSWAHHYGWMFDPSCVHTTRVDCQVTTELSYAYQHLASDIYAFVSKARPKNGRPVTASLLVNNKGGATVYIGSRSSAWYARIYDKGVESGTREPGVLWRWEVECKADAAQMVAGALYDRDGVGDNALEVVHTFFDRHGVFMPFEPTAKVRFNPPAPRDESLWSTLRWLEGPVASAVVKLAGIWGIERALSAVLSQSHGLVDVREIIEMVPETYEN